MQGATIKCPPNGTCHINCHADQACSDSIIISHPQTTSLSVIASGNKVLMNSDITCPININYGDCSISVHGDYPDMISCIDIYAQDSFHDLYLECNNINCYNSTNCHPTIHCKTDHSGDCDMELAINSSSNWQCISPSINDCSITPYPTLHPTQSPTITTISPSIHPSISPTYFPSQQPTFSPTKNPSTNPTFQPSKSPSIAPSNHPSLIPTQSPTNHPTGSPTMHPTNLPTFTPSSHPTKNPMAPDAFGPTAYPSTHWFLDISTTELIDSTLITSSLPAVIITIDRPGSTHILFI